MSSKSWSIQALFMILPPAVDANLAVAGMAGLLASTITALMVGVVFIMRLTGNHAMTLPCFLCALSLELEASTLKGSSIYELLLERTLCLAQQK